MHDRKPGLFGPFHSISTLFEAVLGKSQEPADVLAEALASVDGPDKRYESSVDEYGLVIDVDLPGVMPQDVTLQVTRTTVIVKHPTRRKPGVTTQRYTVSGDYDLDTTEASMAQGRLRVRVARARPAAPRRIAIEYASGFIR